MTWSITSSLVEGEYWTETEVTYVCASMHAFVWEASDVRVCGPDGDWDNSDAPKCAPC